MESFFIGKTVSVGKPAMEMLAHLQRLRLMEAVRFTRIDVTER